MKDAENIHATTVAWDGRGVLLRGPSGSGKSDLAIRLIADGAVLVADDRTVLTIEGGRVIAAPPPALAGRIEARGIGIVETAFQARCALALVVDLNPRAAIERMPDRTLARFGDLTLPSFSLHAFDASAPAKIALALRSIAL